MLHQISLHHLTQDSIPGESHASLAEKVCKGGARLIQFRKKLGTTEEIYTEAKEVLRICRQWNAIMIVNDYVELASEIDADGVHIGKEDMPAEKARKLLGNDKIIGGTANSRQDVESLSDKPVDYIGLGPYRMTTSKENPAPVLGKEILNIARDYKNLNIVAIGGITEDDIPAIIQSHVNSVAISSYINNADDIGKSVASLLKKINENKETPGL